MLHYLQIIIGSWFYSGIKIISLQMIHIGSIRLIHAGYVSSMDFDLYNCWWNSRKIEQYSACNKPLTNTSDWNQWKREILGYFMGAASTLGLLHYFRNIKLFTFSIISHHCNGAGLCNPNSWMIKDLFTLHIFNTMVADDQGTQGNRESATMVLTIWGCNPRVVYIWW